VRCSSGNALAAYDSMTLQGGGVVGYSRDPQEVRADAARYDQRTAGIGRSSRSIGFRFVPASASRVSGGRSSRRGRAPTPTITRRRAVLGALALPAAFAIAVALGWIVLSWGSHHPSVLRTIVAALALAALSVLLIATAVAALHGIRTHLDTKRQIAEWNEKWAPHRLHQKR